MLNFEILQSEKLSSENVNMTINNVIYGVLKNLTPFPKIGVSEGNSQRFQLVTPEKWHLIVRAVIKYWY